MQTSVWHQQRISDPFEVFESFFTNDSVAGHSNLMTGLCEAAFSLKIFKEIRPRDVLFFIGQFESLINAAYILRRKGESTRKSLWDDDLPSTWREVSHTLSPKEVKKPRIVIRKFFRENSLKKWKIILGYIMEYSMGKGCISPENYNGIRISRYLIKLIEASFLIFDNNLKKQR